MRAGGVGAHPRLFALHHSHAGVSGSQVNANDSASDRLGPETPAAAQKHGLQSSPDVFNPTAHTHA